MSEPLTTDDIILDRAIRGTDCKRCTEWAIGMLICGHDTDYLRRLAGQLPPFNLVSISNLRDRALNELGYNSLSDEALLCRAVANELHRNSDNLTALREILDAAKALRYTYEIVDLQPLYLLSYGLEDLDYDEVQYYVDEMDRSNAAQIAKKIVEVFIERHAQPLLAN